MTSIERIDSLPDVSFIDGMTLEDVENLLIENFQKYYREKTGENLLLERADPWYILLLADAVLSYQMLLFIDRAGKMNLLKYAEGDYLDHLGAMKSCPRKEAEPARVMVRFSLEAVRESAEVIPAGTSVTADNRLFFETGETVQIPAGELSVDAECVCTSPGREGNDYAPGEIATLATPTGFVASVFNVGKPYGGRDRESDAEYRMSVYDAMDRISQLGVVSGWKASIRDFNADIEDAMVYSRETTGINQVYILMKGRRFPSEEECEDLRRYLMGPEIRPVGVNVEVYPPVAVGYSLDVTYYVAASDKERAQEICAAAEAAIEEYTVWQSAAFDRDVNPDELIFRIRQAGAKRAVVSSPVFTKIGFSAVAQLQEKNVVFGGIEDD